MYIIPVEYIRSHGFVITLYLFYLPYRNILKTNILYLRTHLKCTKVKIVENVIIVSYVAFKNLHVRAQFIYIQRRHLNSLPSMKKDS